MAVRSITNPAPAERAEAAAQKASVNAADAYPGRGEFKALGAVTALMLLLITVGPKSFLDPLDLIKVALTPDPVSVGNLKVTTQPPAYTGLQMKVEEGSGGGAPA